MNPMEIITVVSIFAVLILATVLTVRFMMRNRGDDDGDSDARETLYYGDSGPPPNLSGYTQRQHDKSTIDSSDSSGGGDGGGD